jgi:hypothetical protein
VTISDKTKAERRREIVRRHKEKDPQRLARTQRRTQLKARYGLTPEDVERILREQGNACAICGDQNPGGQGTWHVDHCHEMKKIRGLLCHHCNTALGLFKDNMVILRSAIRYLKKSRL